MDPMAVADNSLNYRLCRCLNHTYNARENKAHTDLMAQVGLQFEKITRK